MIYIKLKHNNKIDTIKSNSARWHVDIIEKIFYKFNGIYKDKILYIDDIFDNIIERG